MHGQRANVANVNPGEIYIQVLSRPWLGPEPTRAGEGGRCDESEAGIRNDDDDDDDD